MGAKCSSLSNLNNNENLFQLCGSTPITVNDPTWNQIFSFNLQIPLSTYIFKYKFITWFLWNYFNFIFNRSENQAFVEATAPLFQLLEGHHETARNAASLVRVFLIRATELKASAQCEKYWNLKSSQIHISINFFWKYIFSKIFIWQTCNALFVIRVVLTHWIRLEKEASLVRKFTVQTADTGTESLLENLAVQLIEILVDIPLKYNL